MAALSPSPKYRVRSISLPSRSHPSTTSNDQTLTKLLILGASSSSKAESIYTSLSGLQELQNSIQKLILEPLAPKTLASGQLDGLVILLEESVTYIDICSKLRDAIMSMKQGVREVQSSLRRRRKVCGDLSTKRVLKAYIYTRKNVEKEIRKSMMSLRCARGDTKNFRVFPVTGFDEHCLSSYRMKFLREASVRTAFILHSLVSYLLVPVSLKMKPSTWSTLVPKFVQKGLGENEGRTEYLNELEEVEVELSHLLCFQHDEDGIQSVQKKLEAVDAIFEGLENGVGNLYRGLINSRVSLLNIISDQ